MDKQLLNLFYYTHYTNGIIESISNTKFLQSTPSNTENNKKNSYIKTVWNKKWVKLTGVTNSEKENNKTCNKVQLEVG